MQLCSDKKYGKMAHGNTIHSSNYYNVRMYNVQLFKDYSNDEPFQYKYGKNWQSEEFHDLISWITIFHHFEFIFAFIQIC